VRASTAERVAALTGRMAAHPRCLWQQPLAPVDALATQLQALGAAVAPRRAPWTATRELLESRPGVTTRGAESLLAAVGPAGAALRRPAARAQWIGRAPGHHERAGNRLSGRTSPRNRALRAALVDAAHAAGRPKATYLGAQ